MTRMIEIDIGRCRVLTKAKTRHLPRPHPNQRLQDQATVPSTHPPPIHSRFATGHHQSNAHTHTHHKPTTATNKPTKPSNTETRHPPNHATDTTTPTQRAKTQSHHKTATDTTTDHHPSTTHSHPRNPTETPTHPPATTKS